MITCKRSWVFLTIFILPVLLHGAGAFREFSNAAGQTISARPISVFGEQVRLEFPDGRSMNVALGMFDEKDAAYLRDWAIVSLGETGGLLKVEVSRREDKIKEYKQDVNLTNGGVAKDAMEIKELAGYYVITIENRSEFTLDSLRVEYRMFSEQEKRAAKDSDDVNYQRVSGKIEYTIKPKEKLVNVTQSVKMVETELGKGIRWSGGGDLKSNAKLMGVWVKIFYGEAQLHEYALPNSLANKEQW
jgi:hypothetical protein